MNVLITGSGGQLATELVRTAPGHCRVFDLSLDDLDITRENEVFRLVESVGPDVIINGSAYTAVDMAEQDESSARLVNAIGPRNLSRAASKIGCRLVQPSTDFVFDGTDRTPCKPTATPNPLSVYGKTKWEGEMAVIDECSAPWTIVRTAWVYSATGRNFVCSMLNLMKSETDLRIVDDQHGTPTWARSLADAIWCLIDREIDGIQHWTDEGSTTWYGFACAIGEIALETGILRSMPKITPIPTSDYPTPASRPAYSVLEKSGTWAALEGTRCMPATDWKENLRNMMLELKNA